VIRPKRYEDFDGAEVAATRRLLPHIRRAVQMHRQLHAAELQRDGLARALETLAVGAILATADGRILFANRGAEAILRRGRGLGVVGGRLCAESTMLRERLLAMIRQAALTGADQGKHAGGALALPRRGEQPLSLLVCPLPLRHVEFGRSAPTALIFLAAPDRNTATSGEVLCRLYGLTPAEARLLDALLAGTSVNGYAELVGVSAATARTQLRALFAKTGTSRQADLVRVVLTNPIVRLAAKE
jgi:DNA-binding CsgD family transcriptional regulator